MAGRPALFELRDASVQGLETTKNALPTAAWEALGDAFAGQGDTAQAQRCYRNALALGRGDAAVPLAQRAQSGQPDTQPIAIEERDKHGVPRLRE